MPDAIAPFLRELRQIAHLFKWQVCNKTGRIIGWHTEYDDPFTPMQAVAWREKGVRISEEYEAARAIGLEGIVHAVTECCNHRCDKDVRRAVLIEIGMEGHK